MPSQFTDEMMGKGNFFRDEESKGKRCERQAKNCDGLMLY